MKVNRNKICLGKISQNDEGYVDMSPAERISFMWELTAELWSLRKSPYVERRLQRNITSLIKNKQSTRRKKDRLDADYLKKNKKV